MCCDVRPNDHQPDSSLVKACLFAHAMQCAVHVTVNAAKPLRSPLGYARNQHLNSYLSNRGQNRSGLWHCL